MSELIQAHDGHATIRWKLLTGVSAFALAACVSSAEMAKAEDAAHPLIWLKLDGQFSMQKTDLEIYEPPFVASSPFGASSHLGLEKTRPNIWDEGASLLFQPEGSDWSVSASIRYGNTGRRQTETETTKNPHDVFGSYIAVYAAYQSFQTKSSEGHTIVDFDAGKDVGLGKFGPEGTSKIDFGLRFAQFRSANQVMIASQPTNCARDCGHDNFSASFDGDRRFQGLGPSLSWDASAMIAGNPGNGGISIDWGLNGAVLFGRQKMSEQHQTKENYNFESQIIYSSPVYHRAPTPVSRSKRVTVPNLGGFAGVSWRYAAAKVTLGYRADYFFGVLDGGIAAAKKEDRAFYGPFVSIAVGIGD